jgi:hypothetical protein
MELAAKPRASMEPATLGRLRAPRPWAIFASSLALLVLGGATARLALRGHSSEPGGANPVATQQALAKTPFSAARAPQELAAEEAAKVGTPLPLAAATASVPLVRSAQQPAAARTGTRSVVKGSSASCVPPTYVDARGIRHFKEQCL